MLSQYFVIIYFGLMGNQSLCDKCIPIEEGGVHQEIMDVKKIRRAVNDTGRKQEEICKTKVRQGQKKQTKDQQEPSTTNQITPNRQKQTLEHSKMQQLPSMLPVKSNMERGNKVIGIKKDQRQENKSSLPYTNSMLLKQDHCLSKQKSSLANKPDESKSGVIPNPSEKSKLEYNKEAMQNQDSNQKSLIISNLVTKSNGNKSHMGQNLQTDIDKGRSFMMNKGQTEQEMNRSKESSVKTSTFKRLGTDEFLLDSGIRITQNSLASMVRK